MTCAEGRVAGGWGCGDGSGARSCWCRVFWGCQVILFSMLDRAAVRPAWGGLVPEMLSSSKSLSPC